MIHNLQDEKEKLHRKQEASSRGFSDEELMKMIGEVENGEMLQAPVHLKNEVLTHIRTEKQRSRKRQVFTYRAQVLIAMAAAIFLLVLMPAGNAQIATFRPDWMIEQETEESRQEPLEAKAQKRQEKIDANWADYKEKQEKAQSRKEWLENITSGIEAFQIFFKNNFEIWRLIS